MDAGRRWVVLGAILCGLAVTAGAFAAHGLDGMFAEKYAGQTRPLAGTPIPSAQKYLADFKTGAEYQMTHSLALIACGLLAGLRGTSRLLNAAAWSFLGGIVLFSGSLYVLTITGQRWLGMITPIGGVLFLVGWASLALAAGRKSEA